MKILSKKAALLEKRLKITAAEEHGIAASPVTAVPDVIGRPISRLEALRIAAMILEEAERERSEVAAWEASRGIHWEARTL
jgi:hypothetical protein